LINPSTGSQKSAFFSVPKSVAKLNPILEKSQTLFYSFIIVIRENFGQKVRGAIGG
jgi:hypothetical protein